MATSNHPARRFIWVLLTALLAILAFVVFRSKNKTVPPVVTDTTGFVLPGPKKEVIPEPLETAVLADSTTVWMLHPEAKFKAAAGYPRSREAAVDGDMYVEVRDSAKPLVLRSRLLVMTVMGKASFRIIAWAKEAGEEVQVLSGTIKVQPNYKSQFNAPDTLHGNQMVMINKDIDMMEKEKFDATALGAWSAGIRRP